MILNILVDGNDSIYNTVTRENYVQSYDGFKLQLKFLNATSLNVEDPLYCIGFALTLCKVLLNNALL